MCVAVCMSECLFQQVDPGIELKLSDSVASTFTHWVIVTERFRPGSGAFPILTTTNAALSQPCSVLDTFWLWSSEPGTVAQASLNYLGG